MGRIPKPPINPDAPAEIVEHLYRVQREVDGKLEFGSPQNPSDPTSTTRANGTTHNGTLLNVDGSWFDAVLTATGKSSVTCIHNLNVGTLTPATVPNVRWLVFGVMHDGTGADATSIYRVSVWFQAPSAPTANQIVLGFDIVTAGTAPTINADHPVVVSLFFTRAVR